jgi:hypothetical protein
MWFTPPDRECQMGSAVRFEQIGKCYLFEFLKLAAFRAGLLRMNFGSESSK